MSSYVVLARKWRPAQFSNMIGQSHVVKTLSNAIRSQRIHQAYLFTGSRGIGKTSIARILAKVIRCNQTQDEAGIIRSCDACSSCKEIAAGSNVDVLEIDGASNNGVDAVREIRENAKYLPSQGARKIYIIDEVHMLTTAAFNALLKTLEEPPPHVVFIFATTEPQKIPTTILSRCQRFDYRKVTIHQIQNRLTEISLAEGVQTELAALALIARAAEGSMRDALSLLDQVIAFSGNTITVQSVRESIGLIEGQVLLGILTGVFKREPLPALCWIDQTFQQGHDLRILTRSLIECLHATLLAKIGSPNSAALELSEEEWSEIQTLAQLRTLEEIELIFQVFHQGLEWIARSPQPKLVLDVLVIKCATAEELAYVDSRPDSQSASQPAPVLSLPLVAAVAAAPLAEAPLATPLAAPPARPVAQLSVEKNWEGFIDHVRKSRPLLASILEHACDTQFPQTGQPSADSMLGIFFSRQDAYFREQLQSRTYHEQLLHLSKEYLGHAVRLQVEFKNSGESLAARKDREQKDRTISIQEKAQRDPIILEAKSLFGGELGPIEVRGNFDVSH